jgi:uncharacterized protein YjfI (DUF2170 family)
LLKDVYILKIERFAAMPTQMYYGCVFIAAISACIVWARFYRFTVDLFNRTREQAPFVALMSLIAAILYMGIIIITGFHDRYLIPLIILWTVWAVTTDQDSHTRPEAALFIGAAALVATLSIVMMRDFMDIKRAVSQAHNYVITETHTNPCDFDGGFEFNGFHCYRKDFVQREGLSWWWVREEKYLVALGPLPSYTVVKTFPFRRRIGSDGAVHVLEPVGVAR